MTEGQANGAIGKAIRSYFREFGALKNCGRSFWVVQLVNLLDGVAYFSMLTVSTLYLSETLGYNDQDAANLWAACMFVYTMMNFFAGFVGDSLGIRRTLHLSVVLLVASRLAISFTTEKSVVIPALFVIAVGTAIMTPVLIAATKRYTTPKSQTAGFNMLYFFMNVGAFLGNILLDPLRALPWSNRSIFMAGSVMSIACWVAILFFWRRPLASVDAQTSASGAAGDSGSKEEKWEAPWTIAWSVMWQSAFWRFMLFLVLLIGVRLAFEHQYQIYPKYYIRTMSELAFSADASLERELDSEEVSAPVRAAFEDNAILLTSRATVAVELAGTRWRINDGARTYTIFARDEGLTIYAADVPIGALNSINPLIICFGVILSTPIVARFKLFNVMFVGIVISAISMLVLAIHPVWFIDWFGISLAQGYAVIVISQIVLFSFGEMIWSPRLYEYTAAIAPKGREASYMGLSYLPMSMARFSEGPLAGEMLTRYCPPDVTERLATVSYWQSPQFMCLLLAVLAISSPVLIVLFRRVIQKESRL